MSDSTQSWKEHPNMFEINTWVWLNELSNKFNKEITLNNVPKEIFDNYLEYFDAIWLMGVWERSPASRKIAKEHVSLQQEFHTALDNFSQEDIIGSPYAVYYYHIDSRLGGKDGLKSFREELIKREIKLILDYVPNHVAKDHPWTIEKSKLFIEGTREDLDRNPNAYFKVDDKILAHGKDPYFPPWTDTVQIDAFSEAAREKAIKALLLIADKCDAVRCDMAMLVTNKVFSNTWGDRAGSPPETEYWEEIIPRIKEEHPKFKFIGEVYWDMEWELMQQGFDYCYDKRLYDRIINSNPTGIKQHLTADFNYQKKLVRFLENHDEPRILNKMDTIPSLSAATLILTLPGLGLVHEGQMKGYSVRVPVQLGRRQKEVLNFEILEIYRDILNLIREHNIKRGQWELCEVLPKDTQSGSSNIISYHWWKPNGKHFIVVINLSEKESAARIIIPSLKLDSEELIFNDKINKKTYRYKTDDIKSSGLPIDLYGWKNCIFEILLP